MSEVHDLARRHLLDLQGEYVFLFGGGNAAPLQARAIAVMTRDQLAAAILAERRRRSLKAAAAARGHGGLSR